MPAIIPITVAMQSTSHGLMSNAIVLYVFLQILVISPQNLGSDLLLMLSQIRLRHLHILQNRYTPIDIEPMNTFDWKQCVKANSTLKVHLRVESIRERQILWQPSSPVSSIIYKSPNMRVSNSKHTRNIINYNYYSALLCVNNLIYLNVKKLNLK